MYICILFTTIFVVVLLFLYRKYKYSLRILDVTHRAVFITGCDSGFGHGLARRLDSLGVPVYAGCLTAAGASSLQAECSSRLSTVLVDVGSGESVRQAAGAVRAAVASKRHVLWAVVNNAGILGSNGTTEMSTRQDYLNVINVNFLGQVDVVHAFLPMLKQSAGRVVNMASAAAVSPYIMMGMVGPYQPSKSAVYGFTEALRLDMRKWGIRVSVVLPGGHRTPLTDTQATLDNLRTMWEGLPEETHLEYGHEWLDELLENYKKLDKKVGDKLPSVDPVVDAYVHAVLAQHPQNRYIVGTDAHLFALVARLPYTVINWLLDGPLNMLPTPMPRALLKHGGPETQNTAKPGGTGG